MSGSDSRWRGRFGDRDAESLSRFVDALRELYGPELLAVAATGEAASATYRPGRTPLQSVVVLQEVDPGRLRAARPLLRRWARRRIPTPLFLDPLYIEGALDTFPLEFLELSEHHVMLFGDAGFFASIRIDRNALRLEVEEQLRGKMLHLWEAYLEQGGRRRELERLLQEPLPGFELALRGLLRLRELDSVPEPGRPDDRPLDAGSATRSTRPEGVSLIDAVAGMLEIELPVFRRLEQARIDGARVGGRGDDLDELFAAFLAELRRIVRVIDALADPVGRHAT
jgi:hypothetical protein